MQADGPLHGCWSCLPTEPQTAWSPFLPVSAPEAVLGVTYIGAGWQSHVKSRTPGVFSVFIVVVVLC